MMQLNILPDQMKGVVMEDQTEVIWPHVQAEIRIHTVWKQMPSKSIQIQPTQFSDSAFLHTLENTYWQMPFDSRSIGSCSFSWA